MFISLSQAKYNIRLKLALLPYIVISFIFTLIQSILLGIEVEHTNRLFISVQFRSSLLSGKTGKKRGKRLSEFLQKYTDSGTETTHIVGYNILVFKNVKISAGLSLLSMGGISERSSKIRYCIIWRCFNFHGNLSNLTSSEDTLLYLYVI